ncbi:hypothetical protein [Polymorphospora lycopeni]|uniref:Uncharacterized protein n=1 Tax=Polymorphospora lycopeni TaxID=3140240 RepID=A0ABV5CHX0_9ACTN
MSTEQPKVSDRGTDTGPAGATKTGEPVAEPPPVAPEAAASEPAKPTTEPAVDRPAKPGTAAGTSGSTVDAPAKADDAAAKADSGTAAPKDDPAKGDGDTAKETAKDNPAKDNPAKDRAKPVPVAAPGDPFKPSERARLAAEAKEAARARRAAKAKAKADAKAAAKDKAGTQTKPDAKGQAGAEVKPGAKDPAAAKTDPKAAAPAATMTVVKKVSLVKPGDRWSAFAPAPLTVPGRIRRVVHAIGRGLIHEWTLAAVGAVVLAVLMTWPTLRYPQHTIPQDIWDPTLQAWQMAWSGHILLTDPSQLWHSNSFFPERWSFAFSDTLLGYAPAGMIGDGPVAALVRYNIIFVLVHALAFFGAYVLARQLGAGKTGSAVAGAAYTYAPWLLSQAGHLHVLSNGGIPLALAMLARGHGWSLKHGYRPERRHAGWALAGWFVAAWQISLGFGIGLPFVYVLALIVVVTAVIWLVQRFRSTGPKRPFGIKLLLADLFGGAAFAATGLALSIAYFKVAELHPSARRSVGDLELFSPPVGGFFTAPPESRIWGELHAGAREALPWNAEMTLLSGFVLYALAAAGLVFSIWTVRQRLLLLAAVLVSAILSMGTQFFGGTFTYVALFETLPGWDGLRTPGRLAIWTTLLLAILAAGSVSALVVRAKETAAERVPARPGPWLRLATLLPLALVLVEGLNVTPHPIVPAQPAAFRQVDGPMLVLPSNQGVDQHVMLWSTSRFQPVVNGGSGFTPRRLTEIREATASFPDQASVTYLRDIGVRTVVLLRDRVAGTPWQTTIDLPVDSLGIQREDVGEVVVFRL